MRTRLFILLFGGLVLALPGSAQDQGEGQAPAPPAEESAEPAAGESGETATESEETAADGSADAEGTDDEFVFSEEIPAETQLVFPVDI